MLQIFLVDQIKKNKINHLNYFFLQQAYLNGDHRKYPINEKF